MTWPTFLPFEPFLARWRGWLAEYSYKPGWRFEVTEGGRLVVSAEVPDVDGRTNPDGEPLVLTIARWNNLNPGTHGRERICFELTLRDLIRQIEEHELKEWFRRDGRPVEEPHPQFPLPLPQSLRPGGLKQS
jgi:hypothetical protein